MKKLILLSLLILSLTDLLAQRTVYTKVGDTLSTYWIGVEITLSDSVHVQIEGPSKNWFALGLNTKRMQEGIDVIMVPAWKETPADSKPYDAVLTGYAPPKRDIIEHWVIQPEQMKDGRSIQSMVRALATGDIQDFDFSELAKNGGTLDVIWAMGAEKGLKVEYHENKRGKRELTF